MLRCVRRRVGLACLMVLATLGAGAPAQLCAQASRDLLHSDVRSSWRIAEFIGSGPVHFDDGRVLLGRGDPMTGITWTGGFPSIGYEVTLEARKLAGSDFFSAITFPVGEQPCTLVVGGWGGGVVGLSSIEGSDASENETTRWRRFENERWYAIRLRVTPERIEAWIDGEQMVDFSHVGRLLSVRVEVLPNLPFGIATWNTSSEIRDLEVRTIAEGEAPS